MKTLDASQAELGWIGTGTMGAPMCAHLARAGYRVQVHNRTRKKALALEESGAKVVDSPARAAAGADVVVTMVGYPRDVEEVYFGADGVFAGATKGAALVDMTTAPPALARRIYSEALSRGMHAVDAPVSGGDVGARNASLVIMAGGDPHVIQALQPLFSKLGRRVCSMGGPGAGQHAKMCNQIVIAGTMAGVCEALVYAKAAGLSPEDTVEAIKGGAAACWSLENLAPRALRKDFAPGFSAAHFLKDMEIALEESRRMGLVLPGLALVRDLYGKLCADGKGSLGTQALILALEKLSACQEGLYGNCEAKD
jgi:3-hydroxyisobutyrate dehydrogenase